MKCLVCEENFPPSDCGWTEGKKYICSKCCDQGYGFCCACDKVIEEEDSIHDSQFQLFCLECYRVQYPKGEKD